MAESGAVQISQLSVEQLNHLQKQLEEELTFFATSLESLRGFAEKVTQSVQAVDDLQKKERGAASLIPLTESMYIRGELMDPQTTLVELGTGFYAEVPTTKAKDFFERKHRKIVENTEKIEKILSEKRFTLSAITEALQAKIADQISNLPLNAAK
ncbi:unnamed protein product, partial [Mesorhabditis belari]|uniref:Prefoldin subunit 5 n=1 Tax=Mesorhabditis belari TaxID=2138241 RepID=A0AAF3F4T6_9BILA